MILQSLTPSEEEIMQLIWNKGQIYFRELMEVFPEPKPHQNTVSTFLKILVEKHYLTTEKQGRIYLYTPAPSFEDYKKHVLKRFLENYFNNSGTELLELLVVEKHITEESVNNLFEQRVTKTSTENQKENYIQDFIKEITGNKKSKKKDKKKKKNK